MAAYAETSDGNGSEDWYGEVGIAPGIYTLNKDGKYPVSLSVPITVGLGLKDYYFDNDGHEEFLGYFSAALAASVPLPIPSDYGSWSLTGSVQYLYLNAEGLQTINHGDDYEIIGKVGIAFAYQTRAPGDRFLRTACSGHRGTPPRCPVSYGSGTVRLWSWWTNASANLQPCSLPRKRFIRSWAA